MAVGIYITRADADQYMVDRRGDPSSWSTATEAARDAAIREATEWLDIEYGSRWRGAPTSSEQLLAWPRSGVTTRSGRVLSATETPLAVRHACANAALALIEGDTLGAPVAAGSNVKMERVKAGDVEKESEYVGEKSATKSYPRIDGLLIAAELINSGGRRIRG